MIAALLLAAAGSATTPPPPADPLTVTVETSDAERFAALYARTGGSPSAEQIQRDYLDRGSYGVHVFTPGRIGDAARLAKAVAADPAKYARAIRTCLPVARDATAELRAIYLALHGLLPERPLPRIYVVVGAGNSGGTAGTGAQVLGLETLCAISDTPDKLREVLRGFFAHETVHTWQQDADLSAGGPLLGGALAEGAADFIATLATGRQIDPARAAWGAARERELWRQFDADLAVTRDVTWDTLKPGTPAAAAMARWLGNYGRAPAGWPSEAGYWIGQRIWQRWYDRQADKPAAIRRMLTVERPQEILAGGRLSG